MELIVISQIIVGRFLVLLIAQLNRESIDLDIQILYIILSTFDNRIEFFILSHEFPDVVLVIISDLSNLKLKLILNLGNLIGVLFLGSFRAFRGILVE